MKLIDTVPRFTENYPHSIDSLRTYHKAYPEIFHEYFAYHCPDNDDRLNQAIEEYEDHLSTIQLVHERIPAIIEETIEKYAHIYGVEFPVDVNLIVGGFGSNAYTYRQIIPNITFTMERLSPEHGHLQSIVAHEFGHAAHNIITDKAGTDWSKMPWTNQLSWMYREGVATHFSRQIASGLEPSLYFMSHDTGNGWLAFAEANREEIKQAFVRDYKTKDASELFREWFSIRGGKTYGYTGLAYFLGDLFFQNQIEKLGEHGAIVAWREPNFLEEIEAWLYKSE